MTTTKRTLAELRQEIDQIDNDIHRLIMQRSELVQEIAARKSSDGTIMRPGREAQVVRRLIAEHRGAFPKLVLVRIWREIISAFIGMQGPFSAAVYAPETTPGYEKLARAHFGSLVPISVHSSERGVLGAVADGKATVGILPLPKSGMTDPWWRFVGGHQGGGQGAGEKKHSILARLPFAQLAPVDAQNSQALVVSRGAPEASGEDNSFVVLEIGEKKSRSALQGALEKCQLTALDIQDWAEPPSRFLHLIEVSGFVADSDPRLEKLAKSMEDPDARAWTIGSYAVPLTSSELSSSE